MSAWHFYTSKEIKPQGWLKDQLRIQANGLCGNLDKVWRDVRNSAWIGGDADGWERVPYWLDGFVPMAYLLEDEDLITRAKTYMDAIIASQQPDGWLCPCAEDKRPKYDTWTVLLIAKVLTVYYDCSGDERIPSVLYRMMKNYFDLLSNGTIKLFDWGKYRWFEGFVALNFLWERYEESWIKELAGILKTQGMDYHTVEHLWKTPLFKWTLDTHIVNLAMMLKYEAVSCDLLDAAYTDDAEKLLQVLETYNGMPAGTISGDECLAGLSPIHGAELCSVVELMYSYELLYACTGDKKWAERLEELAFNALPAAVSDDMWTHQYDQLSNQPFCIRFPGKSPFRTNGAEAHLFGLEPEFGCCTANFGQGWPKLALSAFLHRDGMVWNALPVPSALETDTLSATLETDYPFLNRMVYTLTAKKPVTFGIRVPSFAANLTVNGTPTEGDQVIVLTAGEQKTVVVEFETRAHLVARPYDLYAVKCGSLLFSLPVEYEKQMREYERNGVERKFPYCDYDYIPKSDWSYGYTDVETTPIFRGVSSVPFSSEHPPVTLQAGVVPIWWGLEDGYEHLCAKVPVSRDPVGEPMEIALYPYGCAKLRMTELPLIKK